MPTTKDPDPPSAGNSLTTFVRAFLDLAQMPRALWIIIGAFVVESSAYFGVLTLMTTFLSTDLGWGDRYAGMSVSIFTMLVTLFMLGFGSAAEGLGLRRAILLALALCTAGRVLYTIPLYGLAEGSWMASVLPTAGWVAAAVVVALLITAVGEAILQPVCYSGVKQYTDARTSSMGYGLIYAFMNLGIVGMGTLSAWVRPAVQNLITPDPERVYAGEALLRPLAEISLSGVQAVNWVCAGLTGVVGIMFFFLMTRSAEAAKLRPEPAADPTDTTPWRQRVKRYFVEGPFANSRFLFFIFMLLPVRTLFAHQWLTMPTYILRAYDTTVGDHMEWLINWINPAIIFIGVPIATALTRRVHVYTMMILGSFVSAVPTFLLCFGADLSMLITYFVIFSVGEALWSARFLEYASELAPPGRVAQFMGLAQVPWLLAKGTTGFYSGWMLANYCPADVPPEQLQTGSMWFIYGCIAMTSPIGLWLARRWVHRGLSASTGKKSE